MSVPHEIHG
ncbi:hypothetical protein ECPA25_3244, partial [Escherichia coli PA25]